MTNANPFAQFQQTAAGQAPAPQQSAASPFGGAAPAPASPQGFGPPPAQTPAQAFGPPPAQTPAQAFGQPAGAPVAAQAPVGGGFGLGLPSINDVSEAGGRLPYIPGGIHLLEFSSNLIKTRKGHTVNINFKIVQTDNGGYPAGSDVTASQKINADVDKRGASLGAVLAPVRALAGFATEEEFKANCPQANALFQAALAGQPLPFAGRRVWCRGVQGEQMIDSRTGLPVPGKFWVKCDWMPA